MKIPKEEKKIRLHKTPNPNPTIKQKGALNILIANKYFKIALLYIINNEFYF